MKTMLRALPVLMAAVLALAPALAAQDTPEQVAGRYFETLRAGDYAANVALMHPHALDELKETMQGLVALAGAAATEEDSAFQEMFGVPNAAAFNQLTSAQVFERMLKSQLDDPDMREVLSSSQTTILGHVMEGDSVAHVVYRMRMSIGDMEMDQVQVAPLKRADGQWRVLLTGSLAGMMGAIPRAEQD